MLRAVRGARSRLLTPQGARGQVVRALAVLGAVAALAVLLRLVYGPGDIGFDALFSLVWGDELRHFASLDYGAAVSPTPHPLANVVGAVVSLTGRAGPDVLIALSFACSAALGVVAYFVGRRAFGTVAGIAFAALLLTRPLLVEETLEASIDIPFLTLVLAALALELGRERRGMPVLALLAAAGLLRPEAWLLSLAYAAYLLAPASQRDDRGRAIRIVALAVAAPLIWMAFDQVTTGAPLHSLTGTQDLAARLRRDRGIAAAIRNLPPGMRGIVGGPVTWSGLAVGAVALWAAQRRARVPLALLTLGLLGFVALGVAGLPLLDRYLLVPSTVLALFCAGGIGAFRWLRDAGAMPAASVALSVAVAVAVGLGASNDRAALRDSVDASRSRRAVYRGVVDLASVARMRGLAARCAPIQAAVYRPVPALAYEFGVRPSRIAVVRPFRARRGLLFAASIDSVVNDVGLYQGVAIPSSELVVPRGFARVASNGWGTLAARC